MHGSSALIHPAVSKGWLCFPCQVGLTLCEVSRFCVARFLLISVSLEKIWCWNTAGQNHTNTVDWCAGAEVRCHHCLCGPTACTMLVLRGWWVEQLQGARARGPCSHWSQQSSWLAHSGRGGEAERQTRSSSDCFLKTGLDEAVVPAVTEFETPSLGA